MYSVKSLLQKSQYVYSRVFLVHFCGIESKWSFRNLEFLADFGLEFWKNPWVSGKISVFSFKKANFWLKIEYFAQSYPKISGFLSFWAKNPWVFGKFFLSLSFFHLEFFGQRTKKNPDLKADTTIWQERIKCRGGILLVTRC